MVAPKAAFPWREGVVPVEVDGELLVLDSASGRVVRLSGPAKAAVEGRRSVRPAGLPSDTPGVVDVLAGLGLTQERVSDADRRAVLRAGALAALGVSVLALPSAAAAATGGSFAVTGSAVDFDVDGTQRLAYWSSATGADSTTFPVAATAVATDSGLTATFGYGGTDAEADLVVTPGSTSYDFFVRNAAATLDTAAAPYLEWTLTTTTRSVNLAALAINSLAATSIHGSEPNNPIVTFTTDFGGDDFSTILRQATTTDDYKNVIVNLTGLSSIPTNTTVRFRMFMHNSNGSSNPLYGERFLLINSNSPKDPLVDPDDTYGSIQSFAKFSFIGQLVG